MAAGNDRAPLRYVTPRSHSLIFGSEPGLGVGLALAREIAELPEGSLEALQRRERAKGSEFTLKIPVLTDPTPAVEHMQRSPGATGDAKRHSHGGAFSWWMTISTAR